MKMDENGVIEFFVPGVPVAKGRPRAYRRKNGSIGAYTPDKTVVWEETIKYYAMKVRPDKPIDGPIKLILEFKMPKSKNAEKQKRQHPTTKPDLDNLEKAVMDALNGIMWTDDARVCQKISSKIYANESCERGVCILCSREKEKVKEKPVS